MTSCSHGEMPMKATRVVRETPGRQLWESFIIGIDTAAIRCGRQA
jgi:hypothetical protein